MIFLYTVTFSRHLLWWTEGRRELELGLGPQHQAGPARRVFGTAAQTDVRESAGAARADH